MKTLLRCTLALAMIGAVGGCDGSREIESGQIALAGVGGFFDSHLKGDTTVTLRRIWEGFPVGWGSSASPDGRYVTATTGSGDLIRIDLVNDALLPIREEGTWSESQAWSESSAFSPDGKRVAYVRGFSGGYEIRIANVDGTGDRVLVPQLDGPFYAIVYAWRGGEIFAEVFGEDPAVFGLAAISDADGSMRLLKPFTEDWRATYAEGPLAVDPSGRFLAYSERSPGGDVDVMVIGTSDGREIGMLGGPANDRAIGWTPDGRSLLIHSDRAMTEGVWRVPMESDQSLGEPELVRGDLWNFEPIGSSSDAYFFGVQTDVRRVRVASFDPNSGRLVSEPTAVDKVSDGRSGTPIWSPDGSALAYTRLGPETNDGLGQSVLVLRTPTGPEAREILLAGMSVRQMLSWTPDGHILMLGKAGSDGDWRVWSVELETGQVETLWEETDDGPVMMPRAAFGNETFYTFSRDRRSVLAQEVASGAVRTVAGPFATQTLVSISLSPDGTTLAVLLRDTSDGSTILATSLASGGEPTEIFRQLPPDGLSQSWVFWAPGGRRLFFATHGVPASGTPPRIWQADDLSGSPEVTEATGMADLVQIMGTDLAFSSDGRRIAFQGGQPKGEIWMMTRLSGASQE